MPDLLYDKYKYLFFYPSVYKTAGKDAAETYLKISECHEKLDVKHDAASALVDAANAYKKVDEERERPVLTITRLYMAVFTRPPT